MRQYSAVIGALIGVAVLLGAGRFLAWDRAYAEAKMRGDLAAMRAVVAQALKDGKPLDVLAEAPQLWTTAVAEMPHAVTSGLRLVATREPNDSGLWIWDRDAQRLYIDCTHTDSRGTVWTSY